MSPHADKARVRLAARSARQGIPADERLPAALAACERALALPQVVAATRVLGFAAAPEELDPAPLLDALRVAGATVCLPRITGPGSLSLHICASAEELEPGPFGIRQPCAASEEAQADSIDLVIVPGVAFDPAGRRLGFGGGYYDRLLAGMPHAYRIALAFEGQIVESVPAEEHDEPVDAIVTPSHVIVTTGRARRV